MAYVEWIEVAKELSSLKIEDDESNVTFGGTGSQYDKTFIEETLIPQAEAIVNGRLAAMGYPVPISQEDDLEIIKFIVINYAAQRIADLATSQSQVAREDTLWENRAERMLMQIEQGKVILNTSKTSSLPAIGVFATRRQSFIDAQDAFDNA